MQTAKPNIITLFKVEGPFEEVKNGFSFVGVIEHDKANDLLKCHVCGKWFKSLGLHSYHKHKLDSDAYRIKYSLPLGHQLCAESTSKKLADACERGNRIYGNRHWKTARKKGFTKTARTKALLREKYTFECAAYKNINGNCDLQLENRYLLLADKLGRQPSKLDVQREEPALMSAIIRRYKTINAFRKEKKLEVIDPQPFGYTRFNLINALREFQKNHKHTPSKRDFQKGSPNYKTFIRQFGSWRRALVMAGLPI